MIHSVEAGAWHGAGDDSGSAGSSEKDPDGWVRPKCPGTRDSPPDGMKHAFVKVATALLVATCQLTTECKSCVSTSIPYKLVSSVV